MAEPAVAARDRRPYVIFLTDRRHLGGDIRLVPAPGVRCLSTALVHRAARFPTERKAKVHLRRLERLGRFYYSIGRL